MAAWDSSNGQSYADFEELRQVYRRHNLVGCLRRWHQGDAPGESWGLIASLTVPCDVILVDDDEEFREGQMVSFNVEVE
ncbi:unnamed protein product, partial [Symbiodinium natans]